jgi:hypothetical protein
MRSGGQQFTLLAFGRSIYIYIEFRELSITIKFSSCLLVPRHSCLSMLCGFDIWSSVVEWPTKQQTSITSSTCQPANYLPNQLMDVVPKAFGSWPWSVGTSCTWVRMKFMMVVLYLTAKSTLSVQSLTSCTVIFTNCTCSTYRKWLLVSHFALSLSCHFWDRPGKCVVIP